MKKTPILILFSIFGLTGCKDPTLRAYFQGPKPPPPHPNLPVLPKEPVAGSRVGILNACSKDIWIQSQNTSGLPELQKVPAGQQYDYQTPPNVPAFKGWAKFYCNSVGENCVIGQQTPGNGGCSNAGCQPPIDTGIEFTIKPAEIDYDISLVNGFTAPMSVTVFNGTGGASCQNIDGSNLSIASVCPTNENLSTPLSQWANPPPYMPAPVPFGNFQTYVSNNPANLGTISLLSQNLMVRNPNTKTIIGCYSPYFKLVSLPSWNGIGIGICPGDNCATQTSGNPNVNVSNVAFDDRVLMYANAFVGCDLAPNAQGNPTQNNCVAENRTPLAASNFPYASAWKTLSGANGFTGFCAGYNSYSPFSPYCSDYQAGLVEPGTNAAPLMARLGPITQTQYVKNVHAATNDALYAWQYDDLNANYNCPSADTKIVYTVYCVQ